MRTIERFECEYCGEEFETKEKAMACEQKHSHPMRVAKSYFASNWDIPPTIDVEMFDGAIIRYGFERKIRQKDKDREKGCCENGTADK